MDKKNIAIYSGGGKEVIISPEGIEIKGGLISSSKGCEVWNGESVENVPNYVQSWYENRRD